MSVKNTERYFARVISPSRAPDGPSVLLTVGTFTPGGDVYGARFAVLVDQFGDQFDIVLG